MAVLDHMEKNTRTHGWLYIFLLLLVGRSKKRSKNLSFGVFFSFTFFQHFMEMHLCIKNQKKTHHYLRWSYPSKLGSSTRGLGAWGFCAVSSLCLGLRSSGLRCLVFYLEFAVATSPSLGVTCTECSDDYRHDCCLHFTVASIALVPKACSCATMISASVLSFSPDISSHL